MAQTFLRKSNAKRLLLPVLSIFCTPWFLFAQNRSADISGVKPTTQTVNQSRSTAQLEPVGSAGSLISPAVSSSISPELAARSRVKLFLHLDKSIYQPGESVWFTGYILNRDNYDLVKKQNTLYVLLIDAENRKPAVRHRFLIQHGIAEGSIYLPDTIAANDYWVIGYTNELFSGTDQPLFRQLITIKNPAGTPFRIIGRSLDSEGSSTDSLSARFRIGTSYSGLASGAKFSYTIFADHDSVGSGEKMIDSYGEVTIPFGRSGYAGRKLELVATVTRDGLTQSFILPLHQEPTTPVPSAPENENTNPAQPPVKVIMSYDASEYHQRSKVTLHIKITDSAGHGLKGYYSLSVAAARKIERDRLSNILNFTPSPNPLRAIEGISFNGTTDPDKPDYGYVLYLDNKPKKRIPLSIMGSRFSTLLTDSSGRFELPYDALVAPNSQTGYVSVTASSPQDYRIMVISKADTLSKQLGSVHYPLNFDQSGVLSDPDEMKMQPNAATLRAAMVKAKVREEFDVIDGEYRSRNCDQDYVCTHHHGSMDNPKFLNCPGVITMPCATTKPVEGARYMYSPRGAFIPLKNHAMPATSVIYHCVSSALPPFMAPLTPIVSSPANFPIQDYSSDFIVGSPLQSTVYWSHLLSTDKNGEASIDFYTNDLTGKFTGILQGICAKGALFGEASYVVNP